MYPSAGNQEMHERMRHNHFHWTGQHHHMYPSGQPRPVSGYMVNPALFPVNMDHVANALESLPLTREYNLRFPPGHPMHQRLP